MPTLARKKKERPNPKFLRGRAGPRGHRGPPGKGIAPEKLQAIQADMAKLRADAEIQLRRIAQLQAQLDDALVVIGSLKEGAPARSRRNSLSDEDANMEGVGGLDARLPSLLKPERQ